MAAYYPPVGFHFKVDIPGVGAGDKDMRFQEVTGLTAEIGVEELTVGGENRFTYRLPTRAKYANVVLKRGMLNDSGLIKWFRNAIENFEFQPVDISVHLLNEKHEVLSSWEFRQAYPVKWVISDFKALENSIVVETIELAYQYFSRK
ncbi:glycerol acyltransferase [Adhaeribacter arboris]|uniref:Glycerol acyltransferase n=1 Tax=Adhaeribacter arboris TaxID=2072846 RepID=A0A2T2Y9Z0_9BACT|nr:phage tail protein [Adhaeribacter arboris]PSR52329.1 glycerol acyltransferase [Adhaeribacter arboris]